MLVFGQSPPRMRGRPSRIRQSFFPVSVSPAYAGKTVADVKS